ncbi:Two-component response regulator, AmiR/NasT family, consists of REC and RNA-binding antiterminator (ANTAR) domains [Loktanella fryxellensis]|uniref:Two-component response regulator, AmiR/NasT family, consists of REC and RNA-binding antiterminator (ANTAR) domains n=1 Tax=Loktanella fryxellensis TaxID=245187 RepID=A0A1H8CDF3_9RHOB|nr:ANTAR domain-containing protein [Loktanella fryxellensis]SEM92992.1 Two-component response regulator, AmiR/NasT family, consists of REC and RNA-binding antiterminator (ANTAR) domains [Loktanella fryxellensis]
MSGAVRHADLGGMLAVILHRPHPAVTALTRQLQAVGLRADTQWPDLPVAALAADFVFFDADMGFDEQFPWPKGAAPMPLIALIGSEAPGRIDWALSTGADAQILKPVGDSGVYSALLIARHGFATRRALAAEADDLRRRLDARQSVVLAVIQLSRTAGSEDAAYAALRRMAMDARIGIEEAAERVLARGLRPTGGTA